MNNTNLILSIILSIAIIMGWQYFYERPRLHNLTQQARQHHQENHPVKDEQKKHIQVATLEESLAQTPRVKIQNANLAGSINLSGARFDDLVLLNYKNDLQEEQNVRLFAPNNTSASYFAEIGWHCSDTAIKLPNSSTLWSLSHNEGDDLLRQVSLNWRNEDGVEFIINVKLDEHYMLFLEQKIHNHGHQTFHVKPYALINRNYLAAKSDTILHAGGIGVIDDQLKEYSYNKLQEDGWQSFKQRYGQWLGITDKYWLTAFIPGSNQLSCIDFKHASQNGFDVFQVDVLQSAILVEPKGEISVTSKLFAGAKEVKLLDKYAKEYNIKLFDRAIDFGWLYVITKPLFYTMSFFYEICGNFGLSIMLVTVLIKLSMFSLSSKSGKSMKRIKELQPEIERLKAKFSKDKLRLNQEMLGLYKRENVNPLSGCLPLLIQIPVFFAIYKVLYVTIEMRHAPFYGWISDLSAADPTSILNLFGLIPFVLPGFLHIGIWPALMSLSMYVQQKIGGQPSMDPAQAQMMKLLPLIFLFTFAGFPAGLLIYWTWSNVLSILQQMYINRYT
jgi:YidC/Oxa1 family membrane protein insertase